MGSKFYVGLVPWLVFAVANRSGAQGLALSAALALLATLAVVVVSLQERRPTLLNGAAIVLFGTLGAAALVLDLAALDRLGRPLAAAGLAAIAWASLLAVPLVEPYTRDVVTPAESAARRFTQANRAVTSIWAWAFVDVTASLLLGAVIATPLAATVLNWLVPGALVLRAVARSTARWREDFDPDDPAGGLSDLGDLLRG
ncbi:MAG: hypothetical protein R2701_11575 [Acidimicrobiales bacterium]|nr:hypothetical protein [Acidimicrobiales bacterium]